MGVFRFFIVFSFVAAFLTAKPTGLEVVSGSAHVRGHEIETTDKACLRWRDFSIDRGEVVKFVQPSSDAAVINRVTSGAMSRILGRLESNGRVYLINPGGLFIGPDAVIDTAAFIASTLDIDIEKMEFFGSSESKITNLGQIHCPDGEVTLLAKYVENEGEIIGCDVLLRAQGAYIKPDGDFDGRNIYAYGVRSSGSVDATRSQNRGGRVYLISDQSRTELTGTVAAEEMGVLGHEVSVFEEASLTGAQILIGGDFQGANPEVLNSQVTYIGPDVVIAAPHGRVVAWSDGAMGYFGTIEASGGEVEVSGLASLEYFGHVIGAEQLLLDPCDVTISVGADTGGSFSSGTYTPGAAPNNITPGTLVSELGANTVVTINTTGACAQSGDITFTSPVTWTNAHQLVCNATRTLTVSADITNTDAGSILFNANQQITPTTGTFTGILISSTVSTVSGDIEMNGLGGDTGVGNRGIEILSTGSVESVDGALTLVGVAGGTAAGNRGISIEGMVRTTGTGSPVSLTLDGTTTGGTIRNPGIYLSSTGTVTSVNHNMVFIGESGGTTSNNHGIHVDGGAVSSTGGTASAATITMTGTGSTAGTSDCGGIAVSDATGIVTSVVGNIMMTGTGGGSTDRNNGIGLETDATISSTGTGADAATITLVGEAGVGTDNCEGIGEFVTTFPVGTITSVDGDISLTGTGHGTVNANVGISIRNMTVSSTGTSADAATITLMGTGSSEGVDDNNGISLEEMGLITSERGDIFLTGLGGDSSGTRNHGISQRFGFAIAAESLSSVTMMGTGGAGTGVNDGIFLLSGTSTTITSEEGDISLTGDSSSTGASSIGIDMGGSVESTGLGSIMLTGTQSAGGVTGGSGVLISGAGSQVVAAGGDITIEGTTSGADSSTGVTVLTTVSNTATGAVTITGSSLAATGADTKGFVMNAAGASTSAVDGALMITGTAGGDGSGNNGIEVSTVSSVETTGIGAINLDGTTSTGTNACSGILISGLGSGVTSVDGDISLMGESSASGFVNRGIHISAGGSVTCSGSGDLSGEGTIAGGTTDNTAVLIESATSTVFVAGGDLSMTGTVSSSTSDATGVHLTAAGTVSSSGMGMLSLDGTATGTSDVYGVNIESDITVADAPLMITGLSTGTSTDGIGVRVANPLTSTGDATITIDGTGGVGTTGNDGIAIGNDVATVDGAISLTGISHAAAATNRGINISTGNLISSTGDGTITLDGTGADGTDANSGVNLSASAFITSVGAAIDVTGVGRGSGTDNSGIVMGLSSAVTSTSGSITLMGTGSASGSGDCDGIIVTKGSLSTAGPLSLTGLAGDHVGIQLETGTTVTGSGASSLTLDGTGGSEYGVNLENAFTVVTGATGAVNIIGRDFGGTQKGIRVADNAIVTTSASSPINCSTFSDMLLESGGQVVGGSGTVTLSITRDLIIMGETLTPSTVTGIILGTGSLSAAVTRNVSLTSGTAASCPAQIGARTTSSANIDFSSIGGALTLTGSDLSSMAIIGHGDPSFALDFGGHINIRSLGQMEIHGADVVSALGTGGFAQIGHISTGSLSGGISLLTDTRIDVIGGTAGSTAYGRIGHALGSVTSGTTLLRAGTDVRLTSHAAPAAIENLGGDLTIVVDNLFPVMPNFGAGSFILGTGSDLNASGELRIYTVNQPLNTVNALVNGQVFVPGAFNVDTNTEQFGTYYPDGIFGGALFKFYYKLGGETDVMITEIVMRDLTDFTIANAQISNILPVFHYMRLPVYPNYHGSFCFKKRCDPKFDPYGSFIFEDNIYWISN